MTKNVCGHFSQFQDPEYIYKTFIISPQVYHTEKSLRDSLLNPVSQFETPTSNL